jgi:hypothetical protein
VRTIPLTQGQVALVDDADYEWLSAFKWYASKTRSGDYYAVRNVRAGGQRRTFRLHQAILPGVPEVDHRNQDKLDNQRHNLREATRAQNQANKGVGSTNTSGFKGVYWHKHAGKWRALIWSGGRQRQIGSFETSKEAAEAYDRAAIKTFGSFAYLNFPAKHVDECHGSTQTAPNCSL